MMTGGGILNHFQLWGTTNAFCFGFCLDTMFLHALTNVSPSRGLLLTVDI